MSALFIAGLILIFAFGFSTSAYITFYKMKVSNLVGKILITAFLGAVISLVTFTISLAIIWPPVM